MTERWPAALSRMTFESAFAGSDSETSQIPAASARRPDEPSRPHPAAAVQCVLHFLQASADQWRGQPDSEFRAVSPSIMPVRTVRPLSFQFSPRQGLPENALPRGLLMRPQADPAMFYLEGLRVPVHTPRGHAHPCPLSPFASVAESRH